MARLSYVLFFVISSLLLLSLAQEETKFNPSCPLFPCGKLGNIGFPLSNRTHPECGLLIVDNCSEPVQKIQLGKDGPWFNITKIYYDNKVELSDDSPWIVHYPPIRHSSCKFQNLTLPSSPFLSFGIPYLPLFRCPSISYTIPKHFKLLCNDSEHSIIHHRPSPPPSTPLSPSTPRPTLPRCSFIPFKVYNTQSSVEFLNLYTGWFLLKVNVSEECYACHHRGGQCQSDSDGNFHCSNARTGKGKLGKLKLGLGLGLGLGIVVSGIGISIILAFYFRNELISDNSMVFWKKKPENYQNIEAFLRNHGSLTPKRYSYSDIKKMTNSFKHKLGQGGFGGVYKGSLLDGRDVAVKVLSESKGNGEEFINEVASISRTSHVNIVALLGFCFEDHKRALIYEFVPNGSLEKFIYEKIALETGQKLKWEILCQIAVGIARGLEYLHRGCGTRILHFDIKPHNILLDKDFCPKISDFGLAKICPGKESIISMTGARGTIGYIAPEVCCRNFGEVSYKSDVYSYGMMVLEIAGGRKNVDVGVDNTSEIYFPHWIYKHLEANEELGLRGITNEDDRECARKMIIVSLWCIQTNPCDRPTMSRVVDMLEGSLGNLQIPPKPFLHSE